MQNGLGSLSNTDLSIDLLKDSLCEYVMALRNPIESCVEDVSKDLVEIGEAEIDRAARQWQPLQFELEVILRVCVDRSMGRALSQMQDFLDAEVRTNWPGC